MLRICLTIVVLGLIGLVAASPATVRSRKDIEDFRLFLENIRNGHADAQQFQMRKKDSPFANEEELGGWYQGDIVLDDEDYEVMLQEYAAGRNAFSTFHIGPWPGNTVVFEFGAGEFNDAQQAAIWEAIKDIEAHTCVKFRYRTVSDTVYTSITGNPGSCNANVGHRISRGVHQMNLARNTPGTGCFRHATIIHEFMHILGFVHMHTTHNRDQYIKIYEENITPGYEHNFDVYRSNNVDNLGIEYDYVSCMHYGRFAFTNNGKATIEAIRTSVRNMGQRRYITDSDWLRINRYHDCPGAWK